MDSDTIERFRSSAPGWFDAWPFITNGRPRRPHNVGKPVDGRSSATMVDPKDGRGACSYIEPAGLAVEGAVDFRPNKARGPVLVCQSQATSVSPLFSLGFWFRLPLGTAPPLDDVGVIAAGFDASYNLLWRVTLANANPQLRFEYAFTPAGVATSFYVMDTGPVDGAWHSFYLSANPGDTTNPGYLAYDSFTGGSFGGLVPVDTAACSYIVFAGDMKPNFATKANGAAVGNIKARSVPMSVACVIMSTGAGSGFERYSQNNNISTATDRWLGDYAVWGGFSAAYTGDGTLRNVAQGSSIGQSVTDVAQVLARTVSGMLWTRYADDVVELIDGTQMRPTTVSLTLTVGPDDDVDAGQVWRRGAQENPTRQTVQSPLGDGTFVDSVMETRERRDGSSVDAFTVSPADSRSLAAWYVRRGRRLRISQFGVDVGSAVQDLWSWVLTQLRPGVRVRLQGLEASQFGYAYRDVHIIGWKEEWGELETGTGGLQQSCRIVFNTVPADTPAELVYDDAVYGRYDFDGVQATIGAISATATALTITTASGPVLTAAAGQYPLWLHVNGEYMQVPSAPASATSPQTVTVVRGVLGSVARAHAAGTAVQLYPQAGYGA
ncbi:hypothetical protein J2S57_003787 [Kineosporia succinea]|uniref:Minor tail protein n=1 Tax=Kineosporia succinea TaxID=84632 RepID=A0ABT9P5S1_9ACTN|nr:hypothetical protein [Kineosporia succinea]MDP9828038.1 hypothetical protein [Kineosporia succinea]